MPQQPCATARQYALALSDQPLLRPGMEVRVSTCEPGRLTGPSLSIPLNETALEILIRCHGHHSVQQIIEDFQHLFVGATPDEIENGVREFLEMAWERGWLERAERY